MTPSYQLGRKGEAIAAAHLIKKKYCILEKNFRYRKAEIDLVVRQNNLVVAVEIKQDQARFLGHQHHF